MMTAGGLIVGGMVASAKAAADFQSQLVLLQTHAGASQQTMVTLGGYILKVAGQLGFDPTSLAEAVYHVQSAMTSLPKSLQTAQTDEQVLYASAQLAAIGHANLEDSVNAVTKAFVVYQKDGYDAASITAIFNKTVGEGNMRLQDLNQAFAGGILPISEQAGISLQSLGAALATMTDEGIPAARAATYLRSAIIQMTQPSNAATAALEAIGVSANDTKSQISSFNQVLVEAGINQTDVSKELQKTGSLGDTLTWLSGKLQQAGVTGQDAGALLEKSFGGIRSGTGIVTLYNNLSGMVQKEKDATSATADWQSTWDTFSSEDPNFLLNQLNASWDTLVIVMGQSFLPILVQIVQQIVPIVQQIAMWIGQNHALVASMAEGAVMFLIVGGAIVFVAGVIGRIIGFIIPVITWFFHLGEALATVGSVFEGTSDTAVTFGAVMADAFGGPITWAITVIGALIAVGVLLVTHWQQVVTFARAVWSLIGNYVREAFNDIRSVVNTELGWMVTIWNQRHTQIMQIVSAAWTVIKVILLGALVAIGISIAITAAVIAGIIIVVLALGAAFMWAAGKLMDLGGFIASFATTAWKALSKFFSDLISTVVNAWTQFSAHPAYWLGYVMGLIIVFNDKAAKAITDFFGWLISTAYQKWQQFNNAADNWISKLPGMLWGIVVQLPGILQSAMNWLATTAWNGGIWIGNTFTSALNALPGKVWDIGRNIVSGLWNGIQSLAGWLKGQIASWIAGLVAGMNNAIRAGSPSALVAEMVGVPMSQGIAMGLQQDLPNNQNVITQTVLSLLNTANQTANNAPGSININQNQNQDINLTLDGNVLARTTIMNVNRWREVSELI